MSTTTLLDYLVPIGRYLRLSGPNYKWQELLLSGVAQTFLVYWLFSFIPFIGGVIYMLLLVPLSARRHIQEKKIKVSSKKYELYLTYFVVITIGFGGLWGFIGHTFLADNIAEKIGWATGSPFQAELAFYTLGSAIAGLMAVWLRGTYLIGLAVTKSIFLLGAAFVHIQDAIVNQNYSTYNIGSPLIGDILIPSVLIYLMYHMYSGKERIAK